MKSFFRSHYSFCLLVATSVVALSSFSSAHKVDLGDVDTLEKLVARVTPVVHAAEEHIQSQKTSGASTDMDSAASMIMLPSTPNINAGRAVDEMRELTQDVIRCARRLTGMEGVETKDSFIDDTFHTTLRQAHNDIHQKLLALQGTIVDPIEGSVIGTYAARARAYVMFYNNRTMRLSQAYPDVFYKGGSVLNVFSQATIYEAPIVSATYPASVHFTFLTVPSTFSSQIESTKNLLRRMYSIIGEVNIASLERSPVMLPEDEQLAFEKSLPVFGTLKGPLQGELRRIVGRYNTYYGIPFEDFEELEGQRRSEQRHAKILQDLEAQIQKLFIKAA